MFLRAPRHLLSDERFRSRPVLVLHDELRILFARSRSVRPMLLPSSPRTGLWPVHGDQPTALETHCPDGIRERLDPRHNRFPPSKRPRE